MAQANSSPFGKSMWDAESSFSKPSSFELFAPSSWSPIPEETSSFIRTDAPKTPLPTEPAAYKPSQSLTGCLTWPYIFALALLICVLGAAVIVLPIVLTNILMVRSTNTTTSTTTTTSSTTTSVTTTSSTTSTTSTTTTTSVTTTTMTTTSVCGAACAATTVSTWDRLAFYPFDSNTNDATGVYSASGVSSPNYTTGYVGSAIVLDALLHQRLWAPSMSLNSQSFTIELWFSLSRVATQDNAFFGQQSASNVGGQCLFLMARLGSLYMGFFNSDISGTTVLQSNTWYHAAFVYDYSAQQQIIYLNGNVEAQSATGVGPYLGTSANMTIGGANVDGAIGTPYFSGLIDHLTVSTRVKSACEISNDASLGAYFPFDGTLIDSGPNYLTATSAGASMVSGRVGQAVYLSGLNSYVQISGLTGLGRPNQPFSIALWVYPSIKGVLLHVHALAPGTGWCTPFMGFSAAGNLITQVYYPTSPSIITGPVLTLNTWTHITQTYSSSNGQRLYINGNLYTSTSGVMYYDGSGVPDFITIGNILNGTYCYTPGINTTNFQGRIDELRIFSREISSIGACILANP